MHNHPGKAAWRKSTFCNGADACVEVAPLDNGNVALRDSKDPDSPELRFTRAEWDAFCAGVRDGEFDIDAFASEARARAHSVPTAGVGAGNE